MSRPGGRDCARLWAPRSGHIGLGTGRTPRRRRSRHVARRPWTARLCGRSRLLGDHDAVLPEHATALTDRLVALAIVDVDRPLGESDRLKSAPARYRSTPPASTRLRWTAAQSRRPITTAGVEQFFRMAIANIKARPIFHGICDLIEAHLTIAFAALTVARYLQPARPRRPGLRTRRPATPRPAPRSCACR